MEGVISMAKTNKLFQVAARITEEDILNGAVASPGSYLKRIASKLDKLAPEDPDPYQ